MQSKALWGTHKRINVVGIQAIAADLMSEVDAGFVQLEDRRIRDIHVFFLGVVFHGLARLHEPIAFPA